MAIFLIVLSVILCLYAFRGILALWSVCKRKRLIKKLANVEIKDYPQICVLLPALREQSIVDSTYNTFKHLNYPADKIKVVFVTTQREEFEYEQKGQVVKTTNQLIEEKLKTDKVANYMHVHYPFEKGNKSSQLNYAIDELYKSKVIDEETYIGVFDFDSEPEPELFNDVAKVKQLTNAEVLQPVPLFLKNVKDIAKKNNAFVFTHAMFQNIRAMGIETFRLLFKGKHRKTPLYCMGASCFIKTKTLIDCDKFPLVDDIQLGFRMLIRNKSFAYVPTIVLGDLPDTLKAVLKQAIFINKGNFNSFKEVRENRKDKKNSNWWGRVLITWEGISVLSAKTYLPYLMLATGIYCIVTMQFMWFLIPLIAAPILRYLMGFIAYRCILHQRVNVFCVFLGMFVSLMWPFFKTYGPLKNMQLSLNAKLFKKEIKFGKTER